MAFYAKLMQIFGQKFYRNVPDVVFYQPKFFLMCGGKPSVLWSEIPF